MSKTELEARLLELRRKADSIRQQHLMVLGAIAECEFWLTKVPEGDRSAP